MRVRELIELLQREDPEMMVVVPGYESGWDDVVVGREMVGIDDNWDAKRGKKNSWVYGRHESNPDAAHPGLKECITLGTMDR